MRERLERQLKALKMAREARARLSSAAREYMAALKECMRAGKDAADMLEHDCARDYFGVVLENLSVWIGRVQGMEDNMDRSMDYLLREGWDIVEGSMNEDEFEEFRNLLAVCAPPEGLASVDRETREEIMARRVVMGLPAFPGGSAGAGEEPGRESVELYASKWLRTCTPSGGVQ